MIQSKDDDMGRFSVEVELANNDDLARARAGVIAETQVRRVKLRGVVDTGATRLVLPGSIADQLSLRTGGRTSVRYADGRVALRTLVTDLCLTYGDRSSLFSAVVEPDHDSALIGAIVLEELDLIADCTRQSLAPRDPKQIVSELE